MERAERVFAARLSSLPRFSLSLKAIVRSCTHPSVCDLFLWFLFIFGVSLLVRCIFVLPLGPLGALLEESGDPTLNDSAVRVTPHVDDAVG